MKGYKPVGGPPAVPAKQLHKPPVEQRFRRQREGCRHCLQVLTQPGAIKSSLTLRTTFEFSKNLLA